MKALRDGQVDLWLLRQPERGTALGGSLDLSELDAAELGRTSVCRTKPNGFLYTSAHIALRRLLGGYLGTPPGELTFTREPCPGCGEPHGRPALATAPSFVPDLTVTDLAGRPHRPAAAEPPLHFSLSHSTGMVLVGVALAPIGVDVEKLPNPETITTCAPAFHPAEQVELSTVAEAERRLVFGQLWTRKEAYLKALGTGLSRPLDLDYLGRDLTRRPAGWSLLDLPCGPAHSAAAAVRSATPVVATLRWLEMESLYPGGTIDLDAPAATVGATPEPVPVPG
ncbi:phosphopantheine-transferase PgaX [Kitasatospora sp. MMS16-BH015]|uniref:4'-phosphopantetheinyl transferase family protein n=1 Tax=Kitasatospora sp. MMS16-BH015 TaxID=2018025 RepID=UPI000CA14ED3|nr:4'-phosphopantetheinyl transferase superfamily protein [Kitasatospora sp. MMS16-BH015]AUG78965.1 phosphopantheine-transferase PgaX [Kitasatospora sp. MMS16-BH015]